MRSTDRVIREVINRLVTTTVLRRSTKVLYQQWFDASCWRAYDVSGLLIMPGADHAVPIIGVDLCLLMPRPIGSMVLQGSLIMNASVIL